MMRQLGWAVRVRAAPGRACSAWGYAGKEIMKGPHFLFVQSPGVQYPGKACTPAPRRPHTPATRAPRLAMDDAQLLQWATNLPSSVLMTAQASALAG